MSQVRQKDCRQLADVCVCVCVCARAHLWASLVKNQPAMQVRSLGWKDPLEKGMAIHSSCLAWRIPWTEEPGGLQSRGSQESDTTCRTSSARAPVPWPFDWSHLDAHP